MELIPVSQNENDRAGSGNIEMVISDIYMTIHIFGMEVQRAFTVSI